MAVELVNWAHKHSTWCDSEHRELLPVLPVEKTSKTNVDLRWVIRYVELRTEIIIFQVTSSYRYVNSPPSFVGYKALLMDIWVLVRLGFAPYSSMCWWPVARLNRQWVHWFTVHTRPCRVLARSWGLCFWIENFKILTLNLSVSLPVFIPSLWPPMSTAIASAPGGKMTGYFIYTLSSSCPQTGPHSFSQFPCLNWLSCYLPEDRNTCFHWGIVCCFYRFGMWELKPVYTHYLRHTNGYSEVSGLRNHKLSLHGIYTCFTVYSYQDAIWLYTSYVYLDSCFVL